jgi:hypothetical protein
MLIFEKTRNTFKTLALFRSQSTRQPGLPDVIFSNQKSQFRHILGCLGIENVAKSYGHLE